MVPVSKPATNNGGSATKKAKKLASDLVDDEAGGECKFPVNRIRTLVRSADPTARASADSIFLINKASVCHSCLLLFFFF
jgi:hypothetical protein